MWCSHPRHPALGAWMAPEQGCDPGLFLGPQVQCIATLQVGSIQAGNASECGQCFSLSWMPSKPHHHLAAGFYDGESLSVPSAALREQPSPWQRHWSLVLSLSWCWNLCPALGQVEASLGWLF